MLILCVDWGGGREGGGVRRGRPVVISLCGPPQPLLGTGQFNPLDTSQDLHRFPSRTGRVSSSSHCTSAHGSMSAASNGSGGLGPNLAGHSSAHVQYGSYGDGHSDAMVTNGLLSSPQFTSRPKTKNSILDSYRHSITPLDSASQFGSPQSIHHPLSSSDSDQNQEAFVFSTASSSSLPSRASSAFCPASYLAHEDVHSHISLSFYATNVFHHGSSLADEEPRSHYAEDLGWEVGNDLDEEDQDERYPFVYAHSLNSSSHISLPSFNTPSSSGIFKHIPSLQQEDYYSEDDKFSQHSSSLLNRSNSQHSSSSTSLSFLPPTEYDVETPVPCPSSNGMALPTFPLATPTLFGEADKEATVGEEEAWSDSVTPFKCCSVSPSHSPPLPSPLSPPLPPSTLYPFKGIEAGMMADEASGEKSAQEAEGKFSHRKEFETGNVEYQGKDSFDNIFTFIKEQMGEKSENVGVDGEDNAGKGAPKSEEKLPRPVQSVASGTQSGDSGEPSLVDRGSQSAVSFGSLPPTQPSTDKAPVQVSSTNTDEGSVKASEVPSKNDPQANENVDASPSLEKSQPSASVQKEDSGTEDKKEILDSEEKTELSGSKAATPTGSKKPFLAKPKFFSKN